MIRVKLEEAVGHEPTASDYDRALKAVEEIKKLAEEEPQFDKVFLKMFQIGNKYFQNIVDVPLWILTLGKKPDSTDRADNWHRHMFDDAEKALHDLKEEADSLAKQNM